MSATTATRRAVEPADLIGKPVISAAWDDEYEYAGEPADGFAGITLGHQARRISSEFQHVAPADTPIPAQDERVVVVKSTAAAARARGVRYPAGPWMLDLPGRRPSWHKTKRDALAKGLRVMAIRDWHDANDATTKDA